MLRVLDLFSGAGGLGLGFEMAYSQGKKEDHGKYFKVVAAVDIDDWSCFTHKFNFPDSVTISADIKDIKGKDILELTGEKEIDIVIGGPPCQGFSNIGRSAIKGLASKKVGKWKKIKNISHRFIDDPRNILYKHFVRLVSELRPKFFVMENVKGMMSYMNGEIVEQIKEDFRKIGYEVEAKILNAAAFGVPQLRERIFFIGNNLGIKISFPEPTHYLPSEENSLFKERKLKFLTVKDAIFDLPYIEGGEGEEVMDYDRPPFSNYQKYMRSYLLNNGVVEDKCFNHRARVVSERDKKIFSHLKQGMWYKDLPEDPELRPYRSDIFHDKMRRMREDYPSWTIVAHLHKDGYMFIHPTIDRTITAREAARLQSFPDKFVFLGNVDIIGGNESRKKRILKQYGKIFPISRTQQYKQIGNAVPPLLARAIAEHILKLLGIIS